MTSNEILAGASGAPTAPVDGAEEPNLHEPDVQRATEIELHGYDFIEEQGRYLKPRDLFSFWWGSNITVVYMLVGGIVMSLGLAFWQAVLIIVLGACGYLLIGYAGVAGPRSGLPTMTLTRAAFGPRGNRGNSWIAYVVQIGAEVLNALTIVLALIAIADELGWHNSGKPGLVLFTLLAMILPAAVAVVGHRLLFLAQKWIAIVLSAALLLVAVWTVPKINWSFHGSVHGSTATWAALLLAMATVFGNPLSYSNVSADYPRYLPTRTKVGPVIGWTFAGVGTISMLLMLLGAGIATKAPGIESDPVSGFRELLPSWLYVLFIINAAFGAMANNAITLYSSGLTMQSAGIPLERWRATMVDCVLSTALVLYIELFNQSFANVFSDYLAFLNIWAGPFLAIMLVDAIARGWRYDPTGLHKFSALSPYWSSGGFNLYGLGAMLGGIVVGLLTVNAPIYTGPIANALNGGDLAWLLPLVVSGLIYLFAAGPRLRAERDAALAVATGSGSA